MIKPGIFAPLLFVMLLAFAGFASANPLDIVTPTGFGFGLGVWIGAFSGVTQTGTAESNISLTKNLGIADSDAIVVPELWYRFGHGQILDFRYADLGQTVTETLPQSLTFENNLYPKGSPETTNMNMQWADLTYEYPVWSDKFPPESDYLNLIGDVKVLTGTFTMTDDLDGVTLSRAPIPAVYPEFGVHGKFSITRDTAVEFKAAGILAGLEDSVGYSYDLEAGVTHYFFPGFQMDLKYRNFTFYNRDSNYNIFGFRLSGPEIDASIHI